MSPILDFVTWLNETPISVSIREGYYWFPIIETVHVLGLGFSAGIVMWLDLRLLGLAMRQRPVTDVIAQIEPWAIGGFIVMFISGFLLLLAEPLKCYTTLAFRIKAIMLVLAGLNVLYFHRGIARDRSRWNQAIPWQAKTVGLFSLFLWLGIVIAGRWTAYF
jgi:hypothetical protein